MERDDWIDWEISEVTNSEEKWLGQRFLSIKMEAWSKIKFGTKEKKIAFLTEIHETNIRYEFINLSINWYF